MKFKKTRTQLAFSSLLLALLMACSEKPEAMLSSAKDYMAKNDSKAAVIQIKNALQSNPDMPEARFMLGTALLDSGDPVGAETELRKALELKHPQDLVIPPLAQAMLAQGQAKKITDELGKTELGTPAAKANFLTTLASAYAMQGMAEPSQAALKSALLAEPGYAPALIVQARQKAAQQDFDGALALADEVIAKSPKYYEAWKLKGDVLRYAKNQPAEALVAYRKTIEIKPDFLMGQAAVITLLLQQNNLADAATQIGELKKFSPNHPQPNTSKHSWLSRKKNSCQRAI
jgi:putative PEP-CTERM system TPR-repeat lipoprotein